jgi:ADYC domain
MMRNGTLWVLLAATLAACEGDQGGAGRVGAGARAVVDGEVDGIESDLTVGCVSTAQVKCIEEEQGRRVQATADASLEGSVLPTTSPSVWLPGSLPIHNVFADASGLGASALFNSTLRGQQLVHLHFNVTIGNSVRTLEITSVDANDSAGHGRYHFAEVTASGSTPVCEDDDYAYVVPGRFVNGNYVHSGGLAILCRRGAAAKAVRLRREPFGGVQKDRTFAATVYMNTAAYCGGNMSYTVDGSPIEVFGLNGEGANPVHDPGEHPPGPDAVYYLEGAWGAAGSVPSDPNFRGGATCLAKWRWQVLPAGGLCAQQLPDPRVDRKGYFCDDVGSSGNSFAGLLGELAEKGGLVFSASLINDRGLWFWRSDGGGQHPDYLSTTAGFWSGNLADGPLDEPPQAGYHIALGANSYIATIRTGTGPDASATKPLYLYIEKATGLHRTTTDELDEEHWKKLGEPLGYVYETDHVPEPFHAVELREQTLPFGAGTQYVLAPAGVQFNVDPGRVIGYGFRP